VASASCALTLVELVGENGRVTGVDVSEALISRARQRWRDLPIRFDVGDAQALAFDDETLDAVRAERVVQHLQRPATAIAEMARVVIQSTSSATRNGRVRPPAPWPPVTIATMPSSLPAGHLLRSAQPRRAE
jgi:ubiquinone/menaquinone biosynthesis C-methylase UbiE